MCRLYRLLDQSNPLSGTGNALHKLPLPPLSVSVFLCLSVSGLCLIHTHTHTFCLNSKLHQFGAVQSRTVTSRQHRSKNSLLATNNTSAHPWKCAKCGKGKSFQPDFLNQSRPPRKGSVAVYARHARSPKSTFLTCRTEQVRLTPE